ncbi:AAEL008838-PA, partial [Aedes aegypti]
MNTTDICRACMEDDCDAFIPLFNSRVDVPVTPAVMISDCGGISVEQDDGLPGVVCTECLDALRVAYKIREKCRTTDRKLRKILNLIRPELPSVVTLSNSPGGEVECEGIPNKEEIQVQESPTPDETNLEEIQELTHFEPEYLVEELKESNEEAVDDSQRLDMAPPLPSEETKIEYVDFEAIDEDFQVPESDLQEAAVCCGCPMDSDKPFKCDQCDKAFSKKCNYNVHMLRIHSSGNQFPCGECDKSFKCVSNLKTHMRVHTKERPYQCDFCPKTFGYLSDKRRHEVGHSGNYPFKCDLCGKPFARKTLLSRHLDACRKRLSKKSLGGRSKVE